MNLCGATVLRITQLGRAVSRVHEMVIAQSEGVYQLAKGPCEASTSMSNCSLQAIRSLEQASSSTESSKSVRNEIQAGQDAYERSIDARCVYLDAWCTNKRTATCYVAPIGLPPPRKVGCQTMPPVSTSWVEQSKRYEPEGSVASMM